MFKLFTTIRLNTSFCLFHPLKQIPLLHTHTPPAPGAKATTELTSYNSSNNNYSSSHCSSDSSRVAAAAVALDKLQQLLL